VEDKDKGGNKDEDAIRGNDNVNRDNNNNDY
jgi:hypothetical protein